MADLVRSGWREHVDVAGAMEPLLPAVERVADLLISTFATGGRLYAFGNGGSAADAQHLAAELIGRYGRDRRPLPAVALTVDPSVITCIANDYAFEEVFARQVEALALPGDVVIGFTTSGRSENVNRGLSMAGRRGAATVAFAGADGLPTTAGADIVLAVPARSTARIQEMHLLLLHLVSDRVDAWAVDDGRAEASASASPSNGGPSPR